MVVCAYALVAAVCLFFDTAEYTAANRVFIKLEIMGFSTAFGRTQDFSVCFVDYDLCFYGMPFLFS